MENRLEFFRRQMAAFDGAADPRGAIENGFYIEEPEHSATNRLFKRICLKPNSRNLLLGGIGSGKTTQLFKLSQLLNNTGDIYPHYIDVTVYENPEEVQQGLLDAIFGLELIGLLTHAGFPVDSQLQALIQKYAYGSREEMDILANIRTAYNGEARLAGQVPRMKHLALRPGVISSPRATQEGSQIKQALLMLIEQFHNHFSKTPFFLLDGLDRMRDVEKFTQVASSVINDADLGFLIVGPVALLYSNFAHTIDHHFNHFEYRSAFDIHNDESAHQFFEQIIKSRSAAGFIREAAITRLISMSGGVLRDLINLAQEAIQEAYLSDAEHVEEDHVKNAERSLGRAKILGLEKCENEILLKMKKTVLEIPTSPEEISLLATGRILEYRYPNRCFAPHPVLRALLSYSSAA
jgi:Cdc6-like AAA superfamily ATPase